MKNTEEIFTEILKNPVTDHVVLSHIKTPLSAARFSNNEINREHMQTDTEGVVAEVGYEKRTATISTSDITEEGIRAAVKAAFETAKKSPADPEYMPPVTKEEADRAGLPETEPTPDDRELRYRILEKMFGSIKNAGLKCAGMMNYMPAEALVMNSAGLRLKGYDTDVSLTSTAMGKNGSYKKFYFSNSFGKLNEDAFIEDLINKTKLAQNPVQTEASRQTVVLGPAAVGELMIMWCWYNMDAEAIDKGRSSLSKRIGKTIAVPGIHIYSDPFAKNERLPFENNGLPKRGFDLVKDGKFVQGCYSRYFGSKKGMVPNGQPSMRMDGTDKNLDELISKVENGLYINSFFYIRSVDVMDGVFTGMTRDGVYRIKDGRLMNAVNNFRWNQNVFELMENTVDIGRAEMMEMGPFPSLTVKDFNLVSRTEF